MTIFLLFAILFVLIYMAGLLPGVIKAIAVLFGTLMVVFMGGLYGWDVVLAGAAAVVAAASFAVYLTYKSIYGESFKPSKPVINTCEQLSRIDERNKAINKKIEEDSKKRAERKNYLGNPD